MNKPKWFDGSWYTTGDTVQNPFSGESYELTGPELSMYDFIMGCNIMFEAERELDKNMIKDFEKALLWFRTHNAKAYMVLLD